MPKDTKNVFTAPTIQTSDIEINDKFKDALEMIESDSSVFVTGRAGTGKSTLLSYFRQTTKKKIAVLAPTGVAAVNVGGQTIHSFFGFKPDITPDAVKMSGRLDRRIYTSIDAIIIDEISMARADLIDCVDKFLRLSRENKEAFGGLQMIFIGDLYQLPPVVTGKEREIFREHYRSPYFFDAKVFEKFSIDMVELEKIYRQKDEKFISLLNSIRNNSISEKGIREINKRLNPAFQPTDDDFYINLTTTRDIADGINSRELARLKSKEFLFRGRLSGSFDKNSLPTDINLRLKEGAQVMLVNNDSRRRWVNGTVGRIEQIVRRRKGDLVIVLMQNGREVAVEPHTWEMFRMVYHDGGIRSETTGTFTQYPLKLAWAVTIHKGQGKTFDKVIVDIGRGAFAHGQVYVALSRCTSIDGLVLRKPIQKKHIMMDWRVVRFLTGYHYRRSEAAVPLEDKIVFIENAIKNRKKLSIVYLKSNDEKSRRIIMPRSIGKMEYMGKQYIGVDAYCFSRRDDRIFRVDRILEMEEAK